MKQVLTNDWADYLDEEFRKDYYLQLRDFLKKEYSTHTIYPPMDDLFNALHYTPLHQVKAVIIGQDPYHGPNQAHGLSFSVQPGVTPPPSLRNIFLELEEDLGVTPPNHGCLVSWARQGVLLLNTVLTVRGGQAHSHQKMGWEHFTNRVIETINDKKSPVVYLLWGKAAQHKEKLIDTTKHPIIKSVHPSPLSAYRGFFGSKPFSKTNELLANSGQQEINWELDDL